MSNNKRSRSRKTQSGGRVTPKGTKPAPSTTHHPDSHFEVTADGAEAPPRPPHLAKQLDSNRTSQTFSTPSRTGHRGNR